MLHIYKSISKKHAKNPELLKLRRHVGAKRRHGATFPPNRTRCLCVCVCVSAHFLRIRTMGPSVTDDKSIGDGWNVEFEFWKI